MAWQRRDVVWALHYTDSGRGPLAEPDPCAKHRALRRFFCLRLRNSFVCYANWTAELPPSHWQLISTLTYACLEIECWVLTVGRSELETQTKPFQCYEPIQSVFHHIFKNAKGQCHHRLTYLPQTSAWTDFNRPLTFLASSVKGWLDCCLISWHFVSANRTGKRNTASKVLSERNKNASNCAHQNSMRKNNRCHYISCRRPVRRKGNAMSFLLWK